MCWCLSQRGEADISLEKTVSLDPCLRITSYGRSTYIPSLLPSNSLCRSINSIICIYFMYLIFITTIISKYKFFKVFLLSRKKKMFASFHSIPLLFLRKRKQQKQRIGKLIFIVLLRHMRRRLSTFTLKCNVYALFNYLQLTDSLQLRLGGPKHPNECGRKYRFGF